MSNWDDLRYITEMDSLAIADQLGKQGLCVWPNFLSPELVHDIRADVELIHGVQGFHRAGIGQGKNQKIHDSVRRDEVHWLDRTSPTVTQTLLWQKLDSLKQAFNRTLYLGLSEVEGHYAFFDVGGFYQRHLDCFQHDNARVVSLVLYLNQHWKSPDGGALRIYGNHSHTDIDPVGGTLVCFLSRESEHEVLPNHAARLSFAGWFKQ